MGHKQVLATSHKGPEHVHQLGSDLRGPGTSASWMSRDDCNPEQGMLAITAEPVKNADSSVLPQEVWVGPGNLYFKQAPECVC